jgi:hypothetical protein
MITGNHNLDRAHASRALREGPEFDVNLRYSGEDDFHLHLSRGDVAYSTWPRSSTSGAEDQLTVNRAYTVHMAENYLRTVNKALARDRERVTLPPAMLDEVMAEAHAWIGEQRLEIGDRDQAWHHLGTSLRFRPWQPRVAALLGAAFLPKKVSDRLRNSYRALKSRFYGS